MGISVSKSALTKGFLAFILLSLGIMVGLIVWTTDSNTWSNLAKFHWQIVPLIIILAIVRWYFDGMAFVTMAKHGSVSNISLNRAAIIRLEGTLVASVVPVLVGTFSMHAYLLHKEKMKLSEAMAITILRAILPVLIFLLNIPILMLMKSNPMGDQFFGKLLQAISLPVVVIIVFFVITLFYPHKIKNMASSLVRWWGRIRFIHVEKIIKLEERVFHEIDQFSKIFWIYLRRRKFMLLKASLWIMAAFVADYFIAIAILWGFGYRPDILPALGMQFLMRPIIYFAFTPGGAGIWEFTYVGFFSLFMPKSLYGISVLLWRLFVSHIPAIVGGIFLIKEFNRDKGLKDMILQKGKLPEEDIDIIDEVKENEVYD